MVWYMIWYDMMVKWYMSPNWRRLTFPSVPPDVYAHLYSPPYKLLLPSVWSRGHWIEIVTPPVMLWLGSGLWAHGFLNALLGILMRNQNDMLCYRYLLDDVVAPSKLHAVSVVCWNFREDDNNTRPSLLSIHTTSYYYIIIVYLWCNVHICLFVRVVIW